MTSDSLRHIIGAALIGLPLWAYGYLWHNEQRPPGPSTHQMFRAPRWLVRLSGRPRPDNQLEVGAVALQVAGLFLFIAPSIMVILGIDSRTRIIVLVLVSLSLMVAGLCIRVLLAIARR
jgi:hypothetical protein